jgi:stage V sporulation protein B
MSSKTPSTEPSNNPSEKKQSYLQGAAILALGTALVKVIGALYKVPMMSILGTKGFGYFNIAYDIYSVLLTISTAGLPVAMSRMISEAQTLGNTDQIKRIYKASLYVFLIIGIAGCSFMMLFARQLAGFMNSPNSWFAMRCLAPAVLFVCIISSYRGFFQGQSIMTPTAISQIMEALSKLIIGLALAWVFTRLAGSDDNGPIYGAGGAILGVSIGTVLSALYLSWKHRRATTALPATAPGTSAKSMQDTMKVLLSIAVPITIGSAGLQIINVIDSKLVLGRLINAVGYSQEYADSLKGIYSGAQTLFNLPAAFVVPITASVIPAITAQLTRRDHNAALKTEESAIRIMSLLALPCGIGLAVLSRPIQQLLYTRYTAEELAVATPLLAILGVAVIFNCIVLLTNAIMQAHGYVSTPVVTMLIGGVVKVIINYILVSRPAINITGAPIGTLCCYITITALNLFAMRRLLRQTPKLLHLMAKPILATAAMAVVAFMAYDVLSSFLGNAIACLGAIALAAVVYVVFVVVLKIITVDDCMLLPKGDKIAKLLHIQ